MSEERTSNMLESFGFISQAEKPLYKFFFLVRGLSVVLFERIILIEKKDLSTVYDYLGSLYVHIKGRTHISQSSQIAIAVDLKKIRNIARTMFESGIGVVSYVSRDESVRFRQEYRAIFPGAFVPGFNPDYRRFLNFYLHKFGKYEPTAKAYQDLCLQYKPEIRDSTETGGPKGQEGQLKQSEEDVLSPLGGCTFVGEQDARMDDVSEIPA